MLGYENRMPFHWCLLAVIAGFRGLQALADEIKSVALNYAGTACPEVFIFCISELEARPEF